MEKSAVGRAGEVAAVRASDGEVLWSTEVPGDPFGGATVVGDLVFTATFEGLIVALARDTATKPASVNVTTGEILD